MFELLSGFNFVVILDPVGEDLPGLGRSAGFSEVSGLEISVELESYNEGGYHHGARQLWKRAKPGNLVLKRGMTVDSGFWDWVQRCMNGPFPLPYLSGQVLVLSPGGLTGGPAACFNFENGLAVRVSAPGLNASGGALPIEELHIAHEGLSRGEP